MKIWNKEVAYTYLLSIAILVVLYIISIKNYLLFHGFVEIFSICIAITIYLIVINSKEYIDNNFLVTIGVAYLFIGFLDLLHTLSYVGMNIFTDYDFYANQLWIATRFMESITILVSFFLIKYKRKININLVFAVYFIITAAIVLSVFYWKNFPICFVAGEGQTTFKIVSEYIISSILLITLVISYISRNYFDKAVYGYIVLSIIFTIFSELAFTFYISNYGLSNIMGHFFKIASFYLIYKAIVVKAVKEPQKTIFMELQNQVNIDELTGLFNRRYLYKKLEEEISRSFRTKALFSIIIFDVDFFKNVNDQHGHAIGDEVLLQIGIDIKSLMRSTDTVGRYGGEEFMVILPSTNINNCHQIAEKIRQKIENKCYGERKIKISVSAGIAEFNHMYNREETRGISILVSDFVNVADVNLYKAKSSGRNKTIGLE